MPAERAGAAGDQDGLVVEHAGSAAYRTCVRRAGHLPEALAAPEQLLVRALRHDAALLQLDDRVAAFHGRQPVGDDQDRDIAIESPDRIENQLLGQVVERARRLIQHEHARLLVQRARDTDALALAAGKPDAPFADDCVIAFGPGLDEFGDLRLPGRCAHPREIDGVARHAERDVLRHRRVCQVDALRHVHDRALPGPCASATDRLAVDENLAFCRRQQSHEQVHHRALAAARAADKSDAAASRISKD